MRIRARPVWSYFYAKINFFKRKESEVMKKKMEQVNNVKIMIIAIGSALSSLLGVLAFPCVLMITSNLVDYATGLIASKFRNQDINSYRSIRGIFKKIAMWLLVVVGAIVDEVIKYSTAQIGLDIKISFLIASIVSVWITCNEIISILENIQDIGVPIPKFLKPLVKNIRSQVESKADILEDTDKGDE